MDVRRYYLRSKQKQSRFLLVGWVFLLSSSMIFPLNLTLANPEIAASLHGREKCDYLRILFESKAESCERFSSLSKTTSFVFPLGLAFGVMCKQELEWKDRYYEMWQECEKELVIANQVAAEEEKRSLAQSEDSVPETIAPIAGRKSQKKKIYRAYLGELNNIEVQYQAAFRKRMLQLAKEGLDPDTSEGQHRMEMAKRKLRAKANRLIKKSQARKNASLQRL